MEFTQFVLILTLMVVDPTHPNGAAPDATAVGYSGDIGACVTMSEVYEERARAEMEANPQVLGFSFDCVAVEPFQRERPLKGNEKRT